MRSILAILFLVCTIPQTSAEFRDWSDLDSAIRDGQNSLEAKKYERAWKQFREALRYSFRIEPKDSEEKAEHAELKNVILLGFRDSLASIPSDSSFNRELDLYIGAYKEKHKDIISMNLGEKSYDKSIVESALKEFLPFLGTKKGYEFVDQLAFIASNRGKDAKTAAHIRGLIRKYSVQYRKQPLSDRISFDKMLALDYEATGQTDELKRLLAESKTESQVAEDLSEKFLPRFGISPSQFERMFDEVDAHLISLEGRSLKKCIPETVLRSELITSCEEGVLPAFAEVALTLYEGGSEGKKLGYRGLAKNILSNFVFEKQNKRVHFISGNGEGRTPLLIEMDTDGKNLKISPLFLSQRLLKKATEAKGRIFNLTVINGALAFSYGANTYRLNEKAEVVDALNEAQIEPLPIESSLCKSPKKVEEIFSIYKAQIESQPKPTRKTLGYRHDAVQLEPLFAKLTKLSESVRDLSSDEVADLVLKMEKEPSLKGMDIACMLYLSGRKEWAPILREVAFSDNPDNSEKTEYGYGGAMSFYHTTSSNQLAAYCLGKDGLEENFASSKEYFLKPINNVVASSYLALREKEEVFVIGMHASEEGKKKLREYLFDTNLDFSLRKISLGVQTGRYERYINVTGVSLTDKEILTLLNDPDDRISFAMASLGNIKTKFPAETLEVKRKILSSSERRKNLSEDQVQYLDSMAIADLVNAVKSGALKWNDKTNFLTDLLKSRISQGKVHELDLLQDLLPFTHDTFSYFELLESLLKGTNFEQVRSGLGPRLKVILESAQNEDERNVLHDRMLRSSIPAIAVTLNLSLESSAKVNVMPIEFFNSDFFRKNEAMIGALLDEFWCMNYAVRSVKDYSPNDVDAKNRHDNAVKAIEKLKPTFSPFFKSIVFNSTYSQELRKRSAQQWFSFFPGNIPPDVTLEEVETLLGLGANLGYEVNILLEYRRVDLTPRPLPPPPNGWYEPSSDRF